MNRPRIAYNYSSEYFNNKIADYRHTRLDGINVLRTTKNTMTVCNGGEGAEIESMVYTVAIDVIVYHANCPGPLPWFF